MNEFDMLRAKVKHAGVEARKEGHRDTPALAPADLGQCELCGRSPVRLVYHRWDSNGGVQLCPRCHKFAESVDKYEHSIDVYLSMKRRIQYEPLEHIAVDSETPLCDILLAQILVGGGSDGRPKESARNSSRGSRA